MIGSTEKPVLCSIFFPTIKENPNLAPFLSCIFNNNPPKQSELEQGLT
jgi:hypothetical protein